MTVKCIANTGKYLKEIGKLKDGYSEQTVDGGLHINEEYFVLGIIQGQDGLYYLIDNGYPDISPVELFEITDPLLSPNMYMKILDKSNPMFPFRLSIIGYKRLIEENDYLYNLLDGVEGYWDDFAKISQQMQKEFNEFYNKNE